MVHLVGRARGPCRTARRPRRRRTRGRASRRRRGADRAGLARRVHVGHRAEQMEQVAVRHADARGRTCAARRSARSAASSRVHGVVSVSEHDERDRGRDPRSTMSAGRGQPLAGQPDAVAEPCRAARRSSPARDEVERRGQHDDAGEDRDEQPHPLDEEAERQRRRRGQHERADVGHAAARRRCARAPAATSRPSSASDLHAGVEPLQQARACARRPRRTAPAAGAPPAPAMVFSTKLALARACRCSRTGTARPRAAAASCGVATGVRVMPGSSPRSSRRRGSGRRGG